MNNSINNNSLKDSKSDILDWNLVQAEMKNKLGLDIYESWLKKISFVEEINNYILLSVPTRFIRDWITSRYLDQILKIIKNYKKEIIRIEFRITENKLNSIINFIYIFFLFCFIFFCQILFFKKKKVTQS